jgi:hypothetical protein
MTFRIPTFPVGARAEVSIERPERYAKQLASHISHKTDVTEIENGWVAKIRDGIGIISPRTDVLILEAQAPSKETLEIVKDVLERHLRKFAAKLESLDIQWQYS